MRDIMDLNIDIPLFRHPVYWDSRAMVGTNLNTLDRYIAAYRDKLPEGAVIDEASILVPNPWHGYHVGMNLREADWEEFNEAEDVVATNPFGTRYAVRYVFYRSPDTPYRIELMMPFPDFMGEAGFSPLHSALWVPTGRPPEESRTRRYPVPHLSFKVPDRRGYGKAIQHLKDQGLMHAQTCQSTYGAFSYWLDTNVGRQIYLKPRHNMRDAGETWGLTAGTGASSGSPSVVPTTTETGSPEPPEPMVRA